jgi:hypothetical protein
MRGGASAGTAGVPAGYRLAQQVPTGDGGVLQLLEDARITSDLHQSAWGTGTSFEDLDFGDAALEREVSRTPIVESEVRLLSASGEENQSMMLGAPLATLVKAPLVGMLAPTFFLTVDLTAPTGATSGPVTSVLIPAQHQLEPMKYQSADGKLKP